MTSRASSAQRAFAPYAPAEADAAPLERGPASVPWRVDDWRLLLLGVVVLSAMYVLWHLERGWVAHDDGALAQSAERLMQGELPHRDFDELYTGGLTYLNAAAFRLFGITLISLRVMLFAVFVAWVPAVFYIASRLMRPAIAAGVTLLCVAWSLPNYPAPLPSWYNLFLAVFGVAALFRWLEVRRSRWLVAAGIAGGLSLLVKVVGLYYVAGVLLFLVQQAHAESRVMACADRRRGLAYSLFVTVWLLLFVATLAAVIRRQLHAAELIQFILPGLLLAGLLLRNEWLEPAGSSRDRFVALARLLGPFVAGAALPVVVFLVPYVRAGALLPLFNGVFLLSTKRFGAAALPMLSPWSMLSLIPAAALGLYARRMAGRLPAWHAAALALVLAGYVVSAGSVPLLYRMVWYGMRALLPVLVLTGVITLARMRRVDAASPLLRAQTTLLLSVAAVCTLVQFPFSGPIYFCYVAPLVILAAAALLRYAPPLARAVPALGAAFLVAFALFRVNTSRLYGMGVLYMPYPPTAVIELPRARVRVPDYEAEMYREMVPMLREHARGGYTWAAPDAPEVYFLSGLHNPTRTLFDFFDDTTGRSTRILDALDRHAVTAVVLNDSPQFSPGIAPDLAAEIGRRYPHAADVGKFQVRWR